MFELAEEELYCFLGQSRPTVCRVFQIGFPRVETHCKYFKPARLGDLVEITVWIGRRTQRTLTFQFEMRRDGETDLIAEASYVVVCINRQFQPIPLPQELLELFGDYVPPLTEAVTSDK